MPNSFVINSRYVLLTYAQCGLLDPLSIVSHLATLNAKCIVGREFHADGNIHLHAFVDFQRKFRSRQPRVFDVEECHPNISPSRGTPAKGYDYAIKDGDTCGGDLERPGDSPAEGGDRFRQLCDCETEESFWRLARELAPRELLCSYTQFRAYANNRFRTELPVYTSPDGVTYDTEAFPGLSGWVERNLGGGEDGDRRR